MRGILLPVVLVAVGLLQVVRIDRVAAEETEVRTPAPSEAVAEATLPKSQWAFSMPYVIQPPDILLIRAGRLVLKSPRKIQPQDELLLQCRWNNEIASLRTTRVVNHEGKLNLGLAGTVHVAGLSMEEASEALQQSFNSNDPSDKVSLTLTQAAVPQPISGEHLVGPDGRVNLGSYGSADVNGLTLEEATQAIEKQLEKSLVDPKVTVDIHAYNSKKVYVITKGGPGDSIVTVPCTGNEKVIDVIVQSGGMKGVMKVWIARPARMENSSETIISVDYQAIAKGEDTSTNHLLWPGDRVFIEYPESESPPSAPRYPVGTPVNSNADLVAETTLPVEVTDAPSNKGPSTRIEKMPAYTIEPPDVITVAIADVVHKSPRTIQPYDELVYRYPEFVADHLPDHVDLESRISGYVDSKSRILVGPTGEIDCGPGCRFEATNFTLDEATKILLVLRKRKNPKAEYPYRLVFAPSAPQISGEHLLGPDGKVNFGNRYGKVKLNGLTLDEAKLRIEEHLSYYLVDPKVTVDIFAYNSKKYYIITKNPGVGDNIVTAPCTGNETVLDAIAAINGLKGVEKVWVERTGENGRDHLVKPVNFEAIIKGKDTWTNHPLWPNDRVFIEYAESETQHSAPKRFPIGAWVNSNAGIAGEMLLAEEERDRHAPATRAAYSETGVREALPEPSKPVRYQIGLVIDPKQTLRALKLKKQGPIMVGESSLMLGTLRVLQKNELVSLFEGQHTVNSGRTDASNIYMHTKAPRVLGNVPNDETVESVETTLEVVERLIPREEGVAFEVRAKLSQGSEFRQIDTAVILNEEQSCLIQLFAEPGASEARDAYLLITRICSSRVDAPNKTSFHP